MGCQFSDEPFRQWLKAVVFFGFSLALKRAIGADCDDSALGRGAWLTVGPSLLILRLDRLYRRLGEIETALEALNDRPVVYDPAEIAFSGVFVSIDREGAPRIERGYVRPEDEPRTEPAQAKDRDVA